MGGGCAEGDQERAIEAIAQPGERGTLVWALAERPASLDPLFADSPAEQLVTRQLHEPLVSSLVGPFDDTRRVPGLALSARPSSDATVWRLRLRPGVRFGDGTPFNAAAVLDNVERWRSSLVIQEIIGTPLVDAPRPDLVRFILNGPDPRFGRRLSSPRLGMVSPQAIAEAAGGALEAREAGDSGTGPFELREHSAESLLLAVHGDWWGSDRGLGPGLDQLEFSVVPDADERLDLLIEGGVQVASELGADELQRVRTEPLLTVIAREAGLAAERSIRGIPGDDPAPSLNGAWRTGIGVG